MFKEYVLQRDYNRNFLEEATALDPHFKQRWTTQDWTELLA